MKDYEMTEPTQHEKAEDVIGLMQDINRRLADRRLYKTFNIPTASISKEVEVKLGRLSAGLGDLADSLERES
jgi:hypothetical protein